MTCSYPLPEHPRPDFQRPNWVNLNGQWKFRFDPENSGLKEAWQNESAESFPLNIQVPFGWGSPLSGVADEADIGWYKRTYLFPEQMKGQRIFLIIGASDWITEGWLDGKPIGRHEGGYTPIELELTPFIVWGKEQTITIRAEDTHQPYQLFGKQGYGNVNGIWQTTYLEARPDIYLDTVHFFPDIDNDLVTAKITLSAPAKSPLTAAINFKPEDRSEPATVKFEPTQRTAEIKIPLKNVKLWDLDNPYLYEVTSTLAGDGIKDEVQQYFGMRKISVAPMPGSDYPYVALNNKPIYLQLCLDQSYHPEGYYTFPSDDFMKEEILISKRLGLNGNRIHIKVEIPRKLYWADKLGLLIMADVPNSWGQPDNDMFAASEFTMREMIKRDMNHPSIFSWVIYNETWGLFTNYMEGDQKKRVYLPATQRKVAEMVDVAKALDPSRLIEDNSVCNLDHVVTDLFTWHKYAPGYEWQGILEEAVAKTYPGSTWNYIGGHCQGNAPMFNSECGNVWGYNGSTGDVDWSWDYHMMLNAFRRHPKCAGWLYTEHHDVCNEWNGYVKYDRTEKFTGIEELFPGMSLRDLHSDAYLALDTALCKAFNAGDTYAIPMYLSLITDRFAGKKLEVTATVRSWDSTGQLTETAVPSKPVQVQATSWLHKDLGTYPVKLPSTDATGVVCFTVSCDGTPIARNFTCFVTKTNQPKPNCIVKKPADFIDATWSQKQWNIFDGLKVNGAGKGQFQYEFEIPQDAKKATFLAEVSAKRLNGKDMDNVDAKVVDLSCMLGGGSHDPSKNANSYPMTDTYTWESTLEILANDKLVATIKLPDDPADHRGILSWFAQKQDRNLSEAGSYGFLVKAEIPEDILKSANGKVVITLRTEANGLAIYGSQFGRYPLDPTIQID